MKCGGQSLTHRFRVIGHKGTCVATLRRFSKSRFALVHPATGGNALATYRNAPSLAALKGASCATAVMDAMINDYRKANRGRGAGHLACDATRQKGVRGYNVDHRARSTKPRKQGTPPILSSRRSINGVDASRSHPRCERPCVSAASGAGDIGTTRN